MLQYRLKKEKKKSTNVSKPLEFAVFTTVYNIKLLSKKQQTVETVDDNSKHCSVTAG